MLKFWGGTVGLIGGCIMFGPWGGAAGVVIGGLVGSKVNAI